jgi:gas vesicle protein
MNIDILHAFQMPIHKKRLQAHFDYLKVSSLVGSLAGFVVGLRLRNPLVGTMIGGVGGVLLAQKTGNANIYAQAKAQAYEKSEREKMTRYLGEILPQASPEAQKDLQRLATKELYALVYFHKNVPQNISEQTVLNVLLVTIENKYPSLFNALKK